MIIPSIDLMDGKAVQLRQGKEKVLEREDVLELALEFRKYGEIAVIDLDAALGRGNNMAIVKKLCSIADCRVGGGIRTIEKANEILRAGAKKIIIGTKAEPEFLKQLPKERVVVAVDSKDGFVVNKGWTEKTNKTPFEAIRELEEYCSEFLFTNINKEGMMIGVEADYLNYLKRLKEATKNKITFAGGIRSVQDICLLENEGMNPQIGMSLYTGKIKLPEAFVSVLEFKGGLIPTVVQDSAGQVLMVGFSNRDSLLKTFETGIATYFSRSRNRLWVKGETSGNSQELTKARYDCDRDALLFTVEQKNFACHTGAYSCFGGKEFELGELYRVILDRMKNPKEGSYTSKIARDEKAIMEKIREECMEIIGYTSRENLVWEISDLIYFVFALMANKGIELEEVKNELGRRRK